MASGAARAGADLAAFLARGKARVEEALAASVPSPATPPPGLHDALRYTLLLPGKRLRGILVLACADLLLANLVPYRPVDNEAYDRATVDRFRPFLERLLADVWTGGVVLSLGENATRWFAPYAADGAVESLWHDSAARFRDTLKIRVRGRALVLAPLPHPSPPSPVRAQFASLVAQRLRG